MSKNLYAPWDAQCVDELHYVCFADVLGFRSLVASMTHAELDRRYRNGFLTGAENAVAQGRWRVEQREGEEVVVAEIETATINMLVVSDSVIFWSDEARCAEFVAIVHAARLLLMWGIGAQIPVRLAIAAGPLTAYSPAYQNPRLNVSTVYGRALTDAYEAERRQQWSGGVVAQSALDLYDASREVAGAPTIAELMTHGLLLEYDIPLHDGPGPKGVAVNWPTANRSGVSNTMIRSAFGRSRTYGPWPQHLQPKVDNTLRFVSDVGHLARNPDLVPRSDSPSKPQRWLRHVPQEPPASSGT